jgi:lysophospholipase L1-like esterase
MSNLIATIRVGRGQTMERHAIAMVTALGAPWDSVGWSIAITWRDRASSARSHSTWSLANGLLLRDRAGGRVLFPVPSDTLAAMGARGARSYLGDFTIVGPRGERDIPGVIVLDVDDTAADLSGATAPPPAPEAATTYPVTITRAVSDVLVGFDFRTATPGDATGALPTSLSYARPSDGFAITDGDEVILLPPGNDRPAIGRLSADHPYGLYLGAACSNLASNSRDPSSFGGVGAVTPPAQSGLLGPDGQPAAVVTTTSGQLGRTAGFIGVATGVPYTGSAWLASPDGTAKTTQLVLGFGSNTAKACAIDGTPRRFDVTHVDATAQIALYLASGLDFSTIGGVALGGHRDATAIVQLETGRFSKMPVITAGAGATTTAPAATRAPSRGSFDASEAVDPGGTLAATVMFCPEGARRELDGVVRLVSCGAAHVDLDGATGLISVVAPGGTRTTTRPLTWERLDVPEIWVRAGALATQVFYRTNEGLCGDLAISDPTPLGAWPTSGKLDLLSGGGNYAVSALAPMAETWRAGKAPAWTAAPQWLPDFRASGAGFRNTNGVAAPQAAGFVATASLARVPVRVDGAQVDVGMYSTLVGFPQQAEITIEVPGVGFTTAQATSFNGRCVVRADVPGAGSRIAYFTNGMSARNNAAPNVPLSTWLTDVTAVDGTECAVVPRTSAPSKLTVVYCDSIGVGQGGTDTAPARQGFVGELRSTYGREVVLEGYGARALWHDKDDLDALVARMVALASECSDPAGVTLYLEMGTNDFGLEPPLWPSVAAYQTAYQSLLTKLRAALPSARIVAPTIMTRTDKTANSAAQTLAQFRTAQQAAFAAAALSNATQPDGTQLLFGSELSDSLHPTTAGHAALASRINALLP